MEGRWARLTLQAQLQGAIDLRKEIKPLAESLIFNQLEVKLFKDVMSLYPVIGDDNSLYYPTKSSIETLKSYILVGDDNKGSSPKTDFTDDIKLLKELNKERTI